MSFLRRDTLAQAVWGLWWFFALIGVSRASDSGLTAFQTSKDYHPYTVEIYFCSAWSSPVVGNDEKSVLVLYDKKLVIENASVVDVHEKELADAIAKQQPCKDHCSFEIKWSFVIREGRGGEIIYQACTDARVKKGLVGDQRVTFTDDLARWVRKYLVLAFDLDRKGYREPVLGDKK